MTDLIQIYFTVGSQMEGERIIQHLVKNRLVACGQICGPIQSTYWWQGKMETSQEWICLGKSKKEKFSEIAHQINKLHSYEIPEIIAVPVAAADKSYAQWLRDEISEAL